MTNKRRTIHGNLLSQHWPWILVITTMSLCLIAYISKFHDHPFSGDPGNWGALGDYFGGIANPLISTIALIFIVKAYYTQRQELAETKEALRDAATHSKAAADAQAGLADSSTYQYQLAQSNLALSLILARVETKQKRISFLLEILHHSTEAHNQGRGIVDIFNTEFKLISGNDNVDRYRIGIIKKIHMEEKEINDLMLSAQTIELESKRQNQQGE